MSAAESAVATLKATYENAGVCVYVYLCILLHVDAESDPGSVNMRCTGLSPISPARSVKSGLFCPCSLKMCFLKMKGLHVKTAAMHLCFRNKCEWLRSLMRAGLCMCQCGS